jgi:hypothetical protein
MKPRNRASKPGKGTPMSNETAYIESFDIESIANKPFTVTTLTRTYRDYNTKTSKNRNFRRALIEAKRNGFAY